MEMVLLLKGEFVEIYYNLMLNIRTNVQANQSSISVWYFLHAWYLFITGCNHIILIVRNVT